MFSVEDRERVRERVLERAQADSRVSSAAAVGAEARGELERWSDIDLTFGVADEESLPELLADWTDRLAEELDAVELFDLQVGPSVYRVFLFPGNLQVDLSFTPQSQFGARGPHFALLFGEVGKPQVHRHAGGGQPATAREEFGRGVHHAVRARICIERGRLWQAEHWIRVLRDHALELACRRYGLDGAYGRDFDRLPPESLARIEPALVRSIDRNELLRALGPALDALLREADDVRELADELAPRLRELLAPSLESPR
jgi:predicted nucleotidyltransferase